jgi:hypothetical protein
MSPETIGIFTEKGVHNGLLFSVIRLGANKIFMLLSSFNNNEVTNIKTSNSAHL